MQADTGQTSAGGRRRLSADGTDFLKLWVFGVYSLLILGGLAAREPSLTIFGGVLLGLSGFRTLRFKVVETDGHDLFVSTFSKTVKVPLALVDSVEGEWWPAPRTVEVRFREPTPIGQRIFFRSQMDEWRTILAPHAVVEELRALVAQAKARYPVLPSASPSP